MDEDLRKGRKQIMIMMTEERKWMKEREGKERNKEKGDTNKV
jgi:hypothetical protein